MLDLVLIFTVHGDQFSVENRVRRVNVVSILDAALNVKLHSIKTHPAERLRIKDPTNAVHGHVQCRRRAVKSPTNAFDNIEPIEVVGVASITIL